MTTELGWWKIGTVFGHAFLAPWLSYLYGRVAKFDIAVLGDYHLQPLRDRPFLIVSNQNIPARSELWPLAYLYYFRQYHHSADSFIFRRVLYDRVGRGIKTVGICGAPWVSPRPWRNWLQRNIGQPLARGQMEVQPEYIVLERFPGARQRRFLAAIAEAVSNCDPILIFPGAFQGAPDAVGGAATDRRLDPASSTIESGAAHIAKRHGLPFLPACIVGSESWKPGTRVTVAFGPPFATDGLSKSEITGRIAMHVEALHAVHRDKNAAEREALTVRSGNDEHVAQI